MNFEFKIVFLATLSAVLTSCEGYYKASGTVYENKNGIRKPLNATTIQVYCGTGNLRGTATTDSTGQYNISGLTSPGKETYYIIFQKVNFETDTVKVKGNRGKTFITLDQTMTKIKQ